MKKPNLHALFEAFGKRDENPEKANAIFSAIYETFKSDVMVNCLSIAKMYEGTLVDYRSHGRDLFQETMIVAYEKGHEFDSTAYETEKLLRAAFIGWTRKIALRKMSAYVKKHSPEAFVSAIAQKENTSVSFHGDDEAVSDESIIDRKHLEGLSSAELWQLVNDPFMQDTEDVLPKDIFRKAEIKRKMLIIHEEVMALSPMDRDILFVALEFERYTPPSELSRIERDYGISRVYFRKKKERIIKRIKERVLERYNGLCQVNQ